MLDPLLRTDEAAAVLRVQPRTMESWRRTGRGPKVTRLEGGGVRYKESDLRDYIEALTKPRSEERA